MTGNTLWFGYLEAGAKSSPVVMDSKLSTGDEKTIYLFNLARCAILEYRRDIVDTKLRALKPEESGLQKELKSAYAEARRNFSPRMGRPLNIPERGRQLASESGDEAGDDEEKYEELMVAAEEDSADEDDWSEGEEDGS
jgi:hypothetical protein